MRDEFWEEFDLRNEAYVNRTQKAVATDFSREASRSQF